jgi:trans-aconitate 2-methyltransferase
MQPDAWNPAQYHQFQRERKQPYLDLTQLIRPRAGMSVVDLGCGPGELTRELHEHLNASSTLGVDSSKQMLSKATEHCKPGLTFEHCAIEDYQPRGKLDLIFSNAALQWVPGHEKLLKRFVSWLTDEGQIAIQIPAMENEVLHTAATQVAQESPFSEALGGFVLHLEVHEPEWYARQIYQCGFREQHVSLRVYPHVLPQRESAIEWMKGTFLTAYQRRLSPEMYQQFLNRYRELVMPSLGSGDPLFLPYRRILMWAQR